MTNQVEFSFKIFFGEIMKYLMSNPIIYFVANIILYFFYGILLGFALIPSGLMYHFFKSSQTSTESYIYNIILIGIGIYIFIIFGLLIFGLFERVFSLGLKPGKYTLGNIRFYQWLIMSSIHTVNIHFFIPLLMGSTFTQIYYQVIGIKKGKKVFINTAGIHDGYLLEIGDNTVIGGQTNITCHMFENNTLTLAKIQIGNNVLIGANCYIMPGVTIADNCNISANSVIKKGKKIAEKSVMMPVPTLSIKEIASVMQTIKNKE